MTAIDQSDITNPKFECRNCRYLKRLEDEVGIITESLILCRKCEKDIAMHYVEHAEEFNSLKAS
jgi:hypothetical protein